MRRPWAPAKTVKPGRRGVAARIWLAWQCTRTEPSDGARDAVQQRGSRHGIHAGAAVPAATAACCPSGAPSVRSEAEPLDEPHGFARPLARRGQCRAGGAPPEAEPWGITLSHAPVWYSTSELGGVDIAPRQSRTGSHGRLRQSVAAPPVWLVRRWNLPGSRSLWWCWRSM